MANELLREPQKWGLIGVEYIFFHQFFNEPLQLELKQLRRQLYGQEDPPVPMTLSEAEQAFPAYGGPALAETEELAERKTGELEALSADNEKLAEELLALAGSIDRKELVRLVDELLASEEAVKTLRREIKKRPLYVWFLDAFKNSSSSLVKELHSKGLMNGFPAKELHSKGLLNGLSTRIYLHAALKILAWPIPAGEGSRKARVFWQVAKRLVQLEEEVLTVTGSLHMALVCGTPPVAPAITFERTVLPGGPLVLRIYSAKVRNMSRTYRIAIDLSGLRPQKHHATGAPDPEAEWVEDGPLPHLKISLLPRSGFIYTPSHVERLLRKEATGKPFYDRRTRVVDIRKRIRTWATASLKLVCGMGGREALRFWDSHCSDDSIRYGFERARARYSLTVPQDVQLHQEVAHVRERLATMGWVPAS